MTPTDNVYLLIVTVELLVMLLGWRQSYLHPFAPRAVITMMAATVALMLTLAAWSVTT